MTLAALLLVGPLAAVTIHAKADGLAPKQGAGLRAVRQLAAPVDVLTPVDGMTSFCLSTTSSYNGP
jgi:hypothetical protein